MVVWAGEPEVLKQGPHCQHLISEKEEDMLSFPELGLKGGKLWPVGRGLQGALGHAGPHVRCLAAWVALI